MAKRFTMRKRMKKLRGLIRLVRPGFQHYKAENAELRDTARLLSSLRDRTALIETYDRITKDNRRIDRRATAPLRRKLTIDARAALDAPQARDRMTEAVDRLRETRRRVGGWTVGGDGFDAAAAGMAKTMKRAQKAMRVATETRDPHDMHAWRKRVKYHWYHARLLRKGFPPLTLPHVELAGELSEILGDHHDLHVFKPLLDDAPIAAETQDSLSEVIADQRARLEAEAVRVGPALLAGDAKDFARRWQVWAETWPAARNRSPAAAN